MLMSLVKKQALLFQSEYDVTRSRIYLRKMYQLDVVGHSRYKNNLTASRMKKKGCKEKRNYI